MDDPRKRLIDTAVRAFGDNAEMKFVASQLLEQTVEPEAPGAEEAIRRWDEVDGEKKHPLGRILFPFIFLLVSAVIWADGLHTFFSSSDAFGSSRLSSWFYGYPAFENEEAPDFPQLTAEQKLLLFGDTSKSTKSEKIKALWDSEPQNPAYFAAYANEFLAEHEKLPPDFLDVARRIDPDNSWFTCVAAGVVAKKAVERGKKKLSRAPVPKTPEWVVLDEARLNEALALVRQARGQPLYHDPLGDLLKKQVRLLPATTPPEVSYTWAYVISPSSAAKRTFPALCEAIAAKAWLCGATGDSATLKTLIHDAQDLLRKRTGTEVTSFLDELITNAQAHTLAIDLVPSAEQLGMSSQSIAMRTTLDELQRIKDQAKSRRPNSAQDLSQRRGADIYSGFAGSVSNRLDHPPPLDENDLTPGRLVDHEILARFCAYGVWMGAMICLVAVWAYRFRTPPVVRRLGLRARKLLSFSDRLLVMVIGVGMPFLYVQVLTRFTRLGGRELSLYYQDFQIPDIDSQPLAFVQWVGFLLLVTLLSVFVIRWRLSKRARALEFQRWQHPLLGLAIACTIAFIPVAGGTVANQWSPGAYVAMGIFSVPALWLAAAISVSLFTNSPKLLQHAVVARALVPAFATAALLAFLAVPFYKAAALHWFHQDKLLRVDPEHPAISKYEYECAVQMRKETRAILGYDP
ncbi:MAG: hypothetical protein EOP88_15230 [Verrucomicrobiaceae bacterium]|nr:MAG: hypothetical protein EOP88_15230 [Verrucomicrobiaceae bacterium]